MAVRCRWRRPRSSSQFPRGRTAGGQARRLRHGASSADGGGAARRRDAAGRAPNRNGSRAGCAIRRRLRASLRAASASACSPRSTTAYLRWSSACGAALPAVRGRALGDGDASQSPELSATTAPPDVSAVRLPSHQRDSYILTLQSFRLVEPAASTPIRCYDSPCPLSRSAILS